MSARRDFWLSCGHHLLDRDPDGRLLVTDEFLKAYLARPELVPPPDACRAERDLHEALLRDPRSAVAPGQIDSIADPDARENWLVMTAWRDHLTAHRTLEAAYLDIVRRPRNFPHLFINQLVQLILRNILDDCDDVFMLRSAEMLFRPQKLRCEDGALTASDDETTPEVTPHTASPLYSLLGVPAATGIEMLDESNSGSYRARSDRFDLALDLRAGQPGAQAFAAVLKRWVRHLLAIDVAIEPLTELSSAPLSWYVGLDLEATRIGDLLWNGGSLDDAARARLIGLYRLTFAHPADMIETIRGEPVYLLMAMSGDGILRIKPQNIIAGLPIRHVETVN